MFCIKNGKPTYINIVVLYDLYTNKIWDIYLHEEKFFDLPHVNVLNIDTVLYDSLTDNHKAAALVAILSRHHLDKLTVKNIPKITKDFLKKTSESVEKTKLITDVIDGRPVFQHRTCAEYFAARCLCDQKLSSHSFVRDHIFLLGYGVARKIVDRILASDDRLHLTVPNAYVGEAEKFLS